MKIIISESQVIGIIKEQILPQYKDYFDTLLDKMSFGKPLSDEEKDNMMRLSRGEDIDSYGDDGEGDEFIDGDPYVMFMDIFPNETEVHIDNEYWMVQKDMDPDIDLEGLLLMSQGRAIFVHPFFDGNKIVVKKDAENLEFKLTDEEIPKTHQEMEKFVDIFIKRGLTGIVERLIKKQ